MMRWGAPWTALSLALILCAFGCETTVLELYPDVGTGEDADTGDAQADSSAVPPPSTPERRVTGRFDLSRDNTPPRSCLDGGDGVAYRVSRLSNGQAELGDVPSLGCLGEGDEVMLIELQGSADDTSNVGEHELLLVDAVEAGIVTFASNPLGSYGPQDATAGGAANHVVLLQRVPSYSRLEVARGGVLTAAPWSGTAGGVLVARVLGEAIVDGEISMSERGFRGGASVEEPLGHGVQGESMGGTGEALTGPNSGGGGGGLGDQTTFGCVQDGNAGGGGGHAAPGQAAVVMDLCGGSGAGEGGLPYAVAGKLFLGSGGGSGGVDNVRVDNPPSGAGGSGGGIIWLLSQSVTGTGRIHARGAAGVGDPEGIECEQGGSVTACYDHSGPGGGGAGGSVRISAPQVQGVRVEVTGGRGGNGYDFATGDGGAGAPGVFE